MIRLYLGKYREWTLLTEPKAVSMARQAEEVERQMRELTFQKSVDAVKPSRRRKHRVAPYSHQSNTKNKSDRIIQLIAPCSRCGLVKHLNCLFIEATTHCTEWLPYHVSSTPS